MHYLPLELDVKGRAVAVIGSEAMLVPKIDRLMASEARVTLYPCGRPLDSELATLCEVAAIAVDSATPSETDLERVCAVFASPGVDVELVLRLSLWARREGRLFCAIDRPERSTFVSPAAVEVSGIGVRCFSAGVSPGLVKRLRDDIASALADERFARFVAKLAELRASLPPPGDGKRAAMMKDAVEGFRAELRLTFPAWFR
jgi:precorrin-2 dehydrogenase/sirohydrochlorin ferrochelatase